MTELLVFGTIAAAIVMWALAEWWREEPGRTGHARVAWTAAAGLMTVHSAAAFSILYGGSHAAAVAATARQTAALTGLASGAGIYLNYALLIVWIGDAIWWWTSRSSYGSRPPIFSGFVRGFVFFMFLNGAVIFADGYMRVLGAIAVATVVIAWVRRRRRSVGRTPALV